jgi:hypothetical protein
MTKTFGTRPGGQPEKRDPAVHNRLRRRVRKFNTQWGDLVQLILGIILVGIAIALLIIGLSVRGLSARNEQNTHDVRESAKAAQISAVKACRRAMLIGPYTLADYKARGVLPPEVAKVYAAAIPKHC